ncbi:NUDIX domain-containing protein [Candidatus Odyssella acanthamoebae]|uniref:NUDIX domain-containing protein n=1 Tax=Candidatus Odyssella acanthamoebae TaxID=91604 RepID=UPI00068DA3FE|nr:NUDIX hydrolase [Candidatus Paracaedibacter acanthamoebae]
MKRAETIKTHSGQKMVSCVLIFDKDGYVLGTARKNDPTAFGMPGGKLEIGDNFYQAAIRETLEETGVDLTLYKLTPIFRAADSPFDVITFYVDDGILLERPLLKPGHGEGVCRWITFKELASGFFPVYNMALLKNLPAHLKKFYQKENWYESLENQDVMAMSNEEVRQVILNTVDCFL